MLTELTINQSVIWYVAEHNKHSLSRYNIMKGFCSLEGFGLVRPPFYNIYVHCSTRIMSFEVYQCHMQ